MLGIPLRLVSKGLIQRVTHSVRLDIGLVVDIESEAVAEFVEEAGLGVVAGADAVDVERTHQTEVAQYVGPGDVVAGELVVFVEIDSLELDGLTVDEELVAHNLEPAESHVGAGKLVADSQKEGVEIRSFGTPAAY